MPFFSRVGDSRSWVVLMLFCCFSSSNAIQWITFAPIATPAREYFKMSTDQLNYLSSVYMIVFAAGVILTCTTFEHWGVRRGVLIGSSLNALGSILKFAPGLYYPSFTAMIIPQTLNALAQLFVLSTPPLIASHYFPPNRRAFATAVASTSNSLGNALALFAPPLIVRTAERRSFVILFAAEMTYCCLVFLGVVFFLKPPRRSQKRRGSSLAVRSSPQHIDPNVDAAQRSPSLQHSRSGSVRQSSEPAHTRENNSSRRRNEHLQSFIDVAKAAYQLLKSRDFVFLLLAFSISMGSVWTFASVLAQILEPFGVGQELAGIMGAVNILAGTAMAYVIGAWVGRSRRYKLTLLICFSFSVLCCAGLIATMLRAPPNTRLMDGMSGFVYVMAGLAQNTAIPICLEFSMEITHPQPESVPAALLMAGANIASLILLSVSSAMLGDGLASRRSAVNVMIMIGVVSIVGGVLALVPVEKLRRHEAEVEASRLLEDAAQDGSVVGNCIDAELMPKQELASKNGSCHSQIPRGVNSSNHEYHDLAHGPTLNTRE